eukprot:TRINITY_DN20449_c0_g1_i1.p1 TRINITY_DN20449_c0_g1~~TRINITY_DN20449_c0_g1_i1.p1  ORF type:complete len:132 (-),score=2.61 TRINITY_DN20449_c0_g1_i1:112-474(-)
MAETGGADFLLYDDDGSCLAKIDRAQHAEETGCCCWLCDEGLLCNCAQQYTLHCYKFSPTAFFMNVTFGKKSNYWGRTLCGSLIFVWAFALVLVFLMEGFLWMFLGIFILIGVVIYAMST